MATGFAPGGERMASRTFIRIRRRLDLTRRYATIFCHGEGTVPNSNALSTGFTSATSPAPNAPTAEPTRAMTQKPFPEILRISPSEVLNVRTDKFVVLPANSGILPGHEYAKGI